MKFAYYFLFLWDIFALLDPEMRIRIQQLKQMRIHADPDPKPCIKSDKSIHLWYLVNLIELHIRLNNINEAIFVTYTVPVP